MQIDVSKQNTNNKSSKNNMKIKMTLKIVMATTILNSMSSKSFKKLMKKVERFATLTNSLKIKSNTN